MLPPPAPRAALDGDLEVDCAIVGGGYTGLACARKLARLRPSWSIAVLEADRIAHGPAGRNSGFVMDLGHYNAKLGTAGNKGLVELARFGQGQLRELVDAHAIECDWTECGRLHVAVEDIGEAKLDTFCRSLDVMGESYERLTAAQTREIIGTSYYRCGVEVGGGAFVQPAALVRGLAATLPSTVTLYETTRVEAIEPGDPVRMSIRPRGAGESGTRGSRVVAGVAVVATNGFTRELGLLTRRIIPLHTFASLSRALTPAECSTLGGRSQWGVVPEERMGLTMRRTADDRLLVRGTVDYAGTAEPAPGALRRARAIHQAAFAARFPDLSEVDLEYTWGGLLGMTLNNTHCLSEVAPNLHIAAAYNGVGIAMGTTLGTLLADRLVGDTSPLFEHLDRLPRPTWLPPDPLLGFGLRLYTSLLQRRAGREL